MAWNVDFIEPVGEPITENYIHYTRSLDWEYYQVFPCQAPDGRRTITVNLLETTGSMPTGWAIAYVCQRLSDFINTDGTPDNYIGRTIYIGESNPVTVTVSSSSFYVVVRPFDSGQSNTWIRVSIDFSGGGGGDEAYFTAVGDSTAGTIDVDIFNYSGLSYNYFTYHIRSSDWSYEDSFQTASHYKTITGLSEGTYRIWVTYTDYNGAEYDIYYGSQQSSTYVDIELSGGGPTGESWHYTQYASQTGIGTSGRTLAYNITSSGGVNEGVYCLLTFASSGTATVSLSRSNMTCYIVPGGDYGYNTQNGAPFLYSGSEAVGGTSRTFDVTAGSYYYLWICGDDSSATGSVTATISLGGIQWSYDSGYSDASNISSTTQKIVSVSAYTGALFRVSFTSGGTATFSVTNGNAYVYVTTGNYGYMLNSGVPLDENGYEAAGGTSITFSVTAGHGYYYVWVQGGTPTTSGYVTVTITPPSSSTDWTEVYAGDINVTSSTRSTSCTLESRKTFKYRVTFATAGKVRIYSEGSVYGSDAIAYWGTVDNSIRPSDGRPVNYDYAWDDTSSSGSTNYNFDSGEQTVSAGTYYLWVKGVDATKAGTITIYVTAPSVSTTKGFWVATSASSSSWTKTSVWLCTTSGWQQITPWANTSSGTNWIEGS